ncbi:MULTISPECIES: adenosylcobinamide-GDP ribazoletransferase [Pseudophaeobacter]|jgi:adenosylcobinamide-GDP ribazoletransferase|uniref:adenosylcobinamide-GDP ribazoletransferase n=1 Tax=Pseudophaeobacter TaxID=1541822 RepID=UPI0024323FB1|nr:adenosylcobinamide-GDP ribazoletransferase [Pseudophaeobacter profundi]
MRKNDTSLVDIPLALVLLTRLPLPRLNAASFHRQARATWAFALAGVAVTLPACLLALLALALGLPAPLAAGILLVVQVLLSGAMHEDGLADCADGFWGGFDPARRLEIMKDSQIGSYGVLALVLSLGLRWQAIALLIELEQIWSLLALAALSRAAMPVVMLWLPNARQSGLSQSLGRPPRRAVGLGVCLAVALALPLLGAHILAVLAMLVLTCLGLGALAQHKIGGQTGDVLGACQQLCEVAGVLTLVAIYS